MTLLFFHAVGEPGREHGMDILAREAVTTEAQESTATFRPLVLVTVGVLAVMHGQLLTHLLTAGGGATSLWSLPRKVLGAREGLEAAALEELAALAPHRPGHLEQLCTRGEPETSTGDRVLEVVYLALSPPPSSGSGPTDRVGRWWPLTQLPPLVEGHEEVLQLARKRLRALLQSTGAAWSLLPEEFSLSDLQSVYETVEGRQLDKRNFRKWVLASGLVEATSRERRDGAHRPARLYRFRDPGGASPEVALPQE